MIPIASHRKMIWKAAFASLIVIAVPIGLTASNFEGRAAFWENAHWTLATWCMTFLGYLGWRAAGGDIRRIRGMMTLGLLSYAVGQILWDIQWAIGYTAFPAPSDIFYLGIAPFLIAGLVSTFRSRVSRGDALVMNMDGAIIFAGLATAIFALYGPRASSLTPLATVVLVAYPVVFLASAGAGLVGALAARAQFRTLNAPYLLLLGLGISGVCWVIWNSLVLDQIIPPGTLVAYGFSFAHLVVGLGVGFWDSIPSTSPRFNRWAKLSLWILPVIIIPMTVIVMVSFAPGSAALRVPISIGGAIVILLAVIRQSLLLWERDILLTRERDLLRRAERELAERRQVEQALRETQERLTLAVRSANVGLWDWDLNTNKVYFSPEWKSQLGYADHEVSSDFSEWESRVHPDDLEGAKATVKSYVEKPYPNYQNEFRMRHKNGSYHWILAQASLLYDEQGAPVRMMGSHIDIAQRKQAESEREKLIAELTAKNDALERFTYTVSHDLRSPLVTINGFLGFLEQDAAAGDMQRLKKDAAHIHGAVDKMQELLNDLLELSRIGRLKNESQLVPFDELAREAVELVQGRIMERGITVHIEGNLPIVFGDRQRLVEVLQNLVDNAAKFIGHQKEPRIEIGQRGKDTENDMPILYVKDNGMGIQPEHHERIFGLFNKLDVNNEGTGIGLALVRRIVEVHGGRIWVESEAGDGSTFYFTLPKAAPATRVEDVL